jgi:hypothetical protein
MYIFFYYCHEKFEKKEEINKKNLTNIYYLQNSRLTDYDDEEEDSEEEFYEEVIY